MHYNLVHYDLVQVHYNLVQVHYDLVHCYQGKWVRSQASASNEKKRYGVVIAWYKT